MSRRMSHWAGGQSELKRQLAACRRMIDASEVTLARAVTALQLAEIRLTRSPSHATIAARVAARDDVHDARLALRQRTALLDTLRTADKGQRAAATRFAGRKRRDTSARRERARVSELEARPDAIEANDAAVLAAVLSGEDDAALDIDLKVAKAPRRDLGPFGLGVPRGER